MADSKRQHLMTDGLVLREYQTIAESDRFVAILTRERGLVRASARGARKMNSRAGAATQQLCYARFSLIPGRDKYIVEDAQPQEVFFPLRQQVDGWLSASISVSWRASAPHRCAGARARGCCSMPCIFSARAAGRRC